MGAYALGLSGDWQAPPSLVCTDYRVQLPRNGGGCLGAVTVNESEVLAASGLTYNFTPAWPGTFQPGVAPAGRGAFGWGGAGGRVCAPKRAAARRGR